LKTSPKGIWDYGMTMNQFNKPNDQRVMVQASISRGGVYPLWVSNGGGTSIGNKPPTGVPGLLEIEPGPAFWLKQDQADPVFYPAGTGLKLGPISDKLGIGSARLVAVAPDGDQTFKANLSVVDLSGDWMAIYGQPTVTPTDCSDYKTDENSSSSLSKDAADTFLQYFSAYGAYVPDPKDLQKVNLVWQGELPADFSKLSITAASEVTVSPDKVVLHYHLDIPKPTDATSLLYPLKPQDKTALPADRSRMVQAGWPFLPASIGLVWLHRRSRKWARWATALLMVLMTLWLSSCLGSCDVKIWGTIDGTYTFKNLEYIDPAQAAKSGGEAATASPVLWKLSKGELAEVFDLTVESSTTDSNGVSTNKISPCKLTISSSTSTGTIGPADSVQPPDSGN